MGPIGHLRDPTRPDQRRHQFGREQIGVGMPLREQRFGPARSPISPANPPGVRRSADGRVTATRMTFFLSR